MCEKWKTHAKTVSCSQTCIHIMHSSWHILKSHEQCSISLPQASAFYPSRMQETGCRQHLLPIRPIAPAQLPIKTLFAPIQQALNRRRLGTGDILGGEVICRHLSRFCRSTAGFCRSFVDLQFRQKSPILQGFWQFLKAGVLQKNCFVELLSIHLSTFVDLLSMRMGHVPQGLLLDWMCECICSTGVYWCIGLATLRLCPPPHELPLHSTAQIEA